MVSLSVTRLVVSGGSRATGRRCDVVSVTELRSIANISLLMRDIDAVDPRDHVRDQCVCPLGGGGPSSGGPVRITDCTVRSSPGARRQAGQRRRPAGGGRGEGALPTLCGGTSVDYREKPIPPFRRGDLSVPSERMDSLAAVLAAI